MDVGGCQQFSVYHLLCSAEQGLEPLEGELMMSTFLFWGEVSLK